MTPLEITILLHCYARADGIPNREAPAVKKAIERFFSNDLIEQELTECGLCCTEKGKAHVLQLCNLPLPTSQWVDREGRQIT